MAPRLPIYLLIDTSGSMSGEPIAAIKNGIDSLVSGLRDDPQALETAWISIITFGGEAKQVVPLTSILEFECPQLTIGGEAKLGAALNLVCECQEREVRRRRKDKEGKILRGDYLPLLFVFSVGSINSEELSTGLLPFLLTKWGNSIAIFGDKSFGELSKRLFEEAIPLGAVSEESLAAAFRWVDGAIDAVWPRSIHGAIPMAANMDLLSPGSFNEQYHRILEQVAKDLFLLERPIRLLLTEGDDGPISKQITITSMHELHRVIGINPQL